MHASSANPQEIARFAALAESWWDPEGPMKPLHKMNPCRIDFLVTRLAAHFGRDPLAEMPFQGLSLLDVGTGAGLIAEPMARMGFQVVGLDAGAETLDAARAHARSQELTIDYRQGSPEDLIRSKERFDVVLAMEIVEHVDEPDRFLQTVAGLVAPGGTFGGATVNRTTKAYLMGIVGAELILRWLPIGTHDWNKFVKPSEFARGLEAGGVKVTEMAGMAYNPLTDSWRLTRDLAVNYLLVGTRAA
ncbi:MAG: bifunctional 2-polyprenyl-6-hydroxyphenol methylase/3-demethylubiquinol 3-O-methyltransferase UbiG [Rhodospirillales bacterium]|nr:bifunctional 2-polyprenyl-6-hydroxyphenol methylase/3-demethylubiquinol 3-O-methyltransferase UbiG [Rhodospirillales bacterium]